MINAAAVRQYELREYTYLQCYYDRDTKRIGLKFFYEEVDRALKCTPQTGQVCLCFITRNFLDFYKIPCKVNTRYAFFYDTNHELYIIDLKQPQKTQVKYALSQKETPQSNKEECREI